MATNQSTAAIQQTHAEGGDTKGVVEGSPAASTPPMQQVGLSSTVNLHVTSDHLTAEAYSELGLRAKERMEAVIYLHSTKLSLNGLKLNSIPPEVFEMKWLNELDLRDNCISHIPTEIVQLTFLKRLDLSNNKLTDIPLEITTLTWLQDLRVSLNSTLPKELQQLARQGFPALMQHLKQEAKKKKIEEKQKINSVAPSDSQDGEQSPPVQSRLRSHKVSSRTLPKLTVSNSEPLAPSGSVAPPNLTNKEKLMLLSVLGSKRKTVDQGNPPSLYKVLACIIQLQCHFRAFLARKRAMRMRAEKKVFQTEQLFYDNISSVFKDFYNPIKEANILSKFEFYDIFSVFADLDSMQQELITTLKSAYHEDKRLAEIYVAFYSQPEVLRLYKQYAVDNHLLSASLNRTISNNTAFANFLKEHKSGKEELANYLSQPIESLGNFFISILFLTAQARCNLLLLNLKNRSFKGEQPIVQEAMNKVHTIEEQLKEAVAKEKENFNNVTNLQKEFWNKPTDLFHQRLLCEGVLLQTKAEAKKSKEKEAYVFLFERSIVVSEKKSKQTFLNLASSEGQYKVSGQYFLGSDDLVIKSDSDDNMIAVVQKKHCILTKTPKEKETWMNHITARLTTLNNSLPAQIMTRARSKTETDSFIKRFAAPKTPVPTLAMPTSPSTEKPSASPRKNTISTATTADNSSLLQSKSLKANNASDNSSSKAPRPVSSPSGAIAPLTNIPATPSSSDGSLTERTMFNQNISFKELEKAILMPEEGITDEKQLKRNKCINEIITTERDYLRDLEFLNEQFREPIKTKKLLIDKEFTDMFSNIMVLVNLNKQLFKDLQDQLLTNPQSPAVGYVLDTFSDYLKMYSAYCMNQTKALGILKTISRENTHPEFREFLALKYANSETGILTLRGFLIKPVQRVCKYPLFIRELMKYTPHDHEDYQKLDQTMKKIETAVNSIEEKTKSLENIEKIAEITQRIDGGDKLGLVEPTRKFLREGSLKEIHQGKEAVAEEVYFYLFNDIIIWAGLPEQKKKQFVRRIIGSTPKKEEKLKLKGKMGVLDLQVSDIADGVHGDIKNVFQIGAHTLSAQSPEEKAAWLQDLLSAVTPSPIRSSSMTNSA